MVGRSNSCPFSNFGARSRTGNRLIPKPDMVRSIMMERLSQVLMRDGLRPSSANQSTIDLDRWDGSGLVMIGVATRSVAGFQPGNP